MFCPKCGSQVAEGSFFCGVCGARFDVQPQNNYYQPQQNSSLQPSGVQNTVSNTAASIKKLDRKKLVIVCCAALCVIAVLFVLFKFVFGGPGDKVFGAIDKTIKADNLEFELIYDHNDKLKGKVMGKDDDFKVLVTEGRNYLLYEDGTFTENGREENNSELLDFMEGIATRDPEKAVEGSSRIKKEIKKEFVKNYKDLIPTARKLLNDTNANYMKSYKKSGDTYKFEIDLFKLYKAAKSDGIQFSGSFKRMMNEIDDDLDSLIFKLEVTLDGGYIKTAKGTVTIKDGDYKDSESMTLKIKNIGKVDEDDFEIDPDDYNNYYYDDYYYDY
ncbi:MAG: hypothetical protein IJ571_00365 [Ruminococcus sp.]|nr:hypothetical protein [Ruminococcus sp.]